MGKLMDKIKLVFLFVGMILFITGYAQDKKATEILDGLQEQTESYENMKVKFTYTMENEAEGINESFEGVLYIMGDAYRLIIAG